MRPDAIDWAKSHTCPLCGAELEAPEGIPGEVRCSEGHYRGYRVRRPTLGPILYIPEDYGDEPRGLYWDIIQGIVYPLGCIAIIITAIGLVGTFIG